MRFTDTITFRFTMLYLAILAILLMLLGCGIYFGLSFQLQHNLDTALASRSLQLSMFPDIISVVASGTFEEETGEQLSFFFYSRNQLTRITHRGFDIPVDAGAVDSAISGKSTWKTVTSPTGGKMRLLLARFTPDSIHIRPERIQPRNGGQGSASEPGRGPEPGERQGPGRGPEPGERQGPGRGPEPGERQGPGRGPEPGDRQGPGRGPEPGERQGPGRGPEPGDRQGPGRTDQSEDKRLQLTATRYDGPGKPPRAEDLPIDIDSPSAAIVVARPMTDIDETLAQLLKTLMIICPLALLLSGWGGIYLARRAFSPVEQITSTAREIQAHDLTRRIEVHSADELGRLAATINDMLERLAGAFERQSQFTSDASHELRSPLAVIEAESTLALQKHRSPEEYEQSMEIIAQEAAQMSALINQLLTLARADAGKEQMKYEKVDLREFLEELCVDAEILCREKELELRIALEERVCASADLRSLRRLMHNLLSNAIHYTTSGGTVTIELLKEGSQALLRVSDTGMGIPEEDLPHIFERFYRVDKARARDEGGSGLGLAMCRHIVEAHRGRIDVESRPGKGSSFTVRLPLLEGD